MTDESDKKTPAAKAASGLLSKTLNGIAKLDWLSMVAVVLVIIFGVNSIIKRL